MATTLQVAQHHDTAKVTDMQRVCCGVGSKIGRHHVGVEVFLRTWHNLCQHTTPFQFFNKIFCHRMDSLLYYIICVRGPTAAGNLRYGVIARTTPWIASQDAPYGQSQPFERTVLQNGLPRIFRASGLEATRRRCVGGDTSLIEHDWEQERPSQQFLHPTPYSLRTVRHCPSSLEETESEASADSPWVN